MVSEGRKVDWREVGEIQADRLVETTPMMKGGGKKKKSGNPKESLASG